MSELSKRSTVYFKTEIHQALRIKAATTHQSVSKVVNECINIDQVCTPHHSPTSWHSLLFRLQDVSDQLCIIGEIGSTSSGSRQSGALTPKPGE